MSTAPSTFRDCKMVLLYSVMIVVVSSVDSIIANIGPIELLLFRFSQRPFFGGPFFGFFFGSQYSFYTRFT